MTAPVEGATHTLTVNNISDLKGNTIAPDSREQLKYRDTFQDGIAPDVSYSGTTDSYISEDEPESNFGSEDELEVEADEGDDEDLASLIRWDISTIPRGSIVRSVEIAIDVSDDSDDDYELYELRRDWVEQEVSWNSASAESAWEVPGAQGVSDRGMAVLGSLSPGSEEVDHINLNPASVALVQRWVDDPPSNKGVILVNVTGDGDLEFESRESSNATSRPRLTVTYDVPAKALLTITGVLDAAGGQALISPGSLVSVFGDLVEATATANSIPLPEDLNGFSVTFDGIPAALFGAFDGPFDQSNVQVPWNIDVSRGRVEVKVHWNDETHNVWSDPLRGRRCFGLAWNLYVPAGDGPGDRHQF